MSVFALRSRAVVFRGCLDTLTVEDGSIFSCHESGVGHDGRPGWSGILFVASLALGTCNVVFTVEEDAPIQGSVHCPITRMIVKALGFILQ